MQDVADAVLKGVVQTALNLEGRMGGVMRIVGEVVSLPSAAVLDEAAAQIRVTPADVDGVSSPVQNVGPGPSGGNGCPDEPWLEAQKALPVHAATSRLYAWRAILRTREMRSLMRATGTPVLEAIDPASSPSARSRISRRSRAVRAEVE